MEPRRPAGADSPASTGPSRDPEAKLDCSAAVARLPERERFAIALVYGLGYPQEQAAQVLGVARGTVAASLWKARKKLARELAPAAGKELER